MAKIYISGREASLWQKILIGILSFGALVLSIFVGWILLIVGGIVAIALYITFKIKMRKFQKQYEKMQQTQQKDPRSPGQDDVIIEGEYKEL